MSSFNSYVKVAKSTKLLLTGIAAATGKAAAGKLLSKLCCTAAAIADSREITRNYFKSGRLSENSKNLQKFSI